MKPAPRPLIKKDTHKKLKELAQKRQESSEHKDPDWANRFRKQLLS